MRRAEGIDSVSFLKTNIIFQNNFILRNTAQMCRLLAVDGGGLGPSVNPALVD